MALSEHSPRHAVGQRWNAWFSVRTLALVASSCYISVANAATLSPQYVQRRTPIAGGLDLRVLPIGDSITWGAQSSDETGYRLSLDHEGHRGYIIDEINTASDVGIYAAPNIVLLHAGTNDMNKDVDVGNAPSRLQNLIDKIFEHSPNAAVFVCQIIPSTTAATQARINVFNDAIPGLVSTYIAAGKNTAYTPMTEAT
ncbi:hypothetical protein O1611_g3618 [Lasiodiplodia mahajangana]|uniref:Uncharacterized protein n=1 Tax=Lasiodiplodia mahajangana TaxID=1108764 RepID=A0ACC2JS33_9PEZI|nr:hypothetical protein O1611_g3618 [Lasiodiplodia mahajangana]